MKARGNNDRNYCVNNDKHEENSQLVSNVNEYMFRSPAGCNCNSGQIILKENCPFVR